MDETTVSTPVEPTVEDTSANTEPDVTQNQGDNDTSAAEPSTKDVTAETENNTEKNTEQSQTEILYAGKYKSVEELEKGYSEAQKFISKSAELEKKYNELLEKQATEAQQAEQKRLEQAQMRGFRTVEEQEIANKIQVAEFDCFVANLNQILPEHYETVQQCLQAYYQTANKVYLDEAKRYFPSEFIENVALQKAQMEHKLKSEFQTTQQEKLNKQSQELAEVLKTDYAEFLSDLNVNEGKAQALKSFCDVGSINSSEDMKVFSDIYSKIAKYEREQAIKELDAQKTIEATKQKAFIDTGNDGFSTPSELKESYTAAEIGLMSQEQYDKLCDKYGIEFEKRIK